MLEPTKRFVAGLLVFIAAFTLIYPVPQHAARSQEPSTQRIESEDAHVIRLGNWSSQAAYAASGGSYLYGGGGAEDALMLQFYGPALEVLYVSGPNLGTLAIEVDDSVLRTVITASDTTQYGQSATINYLSDEWHIVKVYAQAGGTVAIDAFVANLDAPPLETPPVDDPPHHSPRMAELNHVLINEVDPGDSDAIELFNPTTSVVNLTGWHLRTYYNNALEGSGFTFPSFFLFPGAYVVLHEGAGTATLTDLYLGYSSVMEMNYNVAIILENSSSQGVDFVRWGGSTILPSLPDTWTGSPTFSRDPNYTLGRSPENDDDDSEYDWFTQCPTLGKVNSGCLVLNEFYTGVTDAVEIYNRSSRTITLTGYQFTSYSSTSTVDGTYTFPTASIPPGGYVVVVDTTGTNTATTFYAGFNFAWNNGDGGGLLTTGGGSIIDFARWGSTTILPSGAHWIGTAIPISPLDESSVQRRSGYGYGNGPSSWCPNVGTLGTRNRPCVVISEVYGFEPDGIEIYNASLAAYTLTGSVVYLYDYDGSTGVYYVVPTFTLAAGAHVRIVEGTGTNTSTVLYGGGELLWTAGDPGAAILLYGSGHGADFVRWGSNDYLGASGTYMTSPNAPAIPSSSSGTSLGRNTSGGDDNEGADWCVQPSTPSARNYGCPARLAVFNPASNGVSLVDSPTNQPPVNTFFTYASGLPAAGTNGQWVMGDWDGDGMKTPGVYGTNGVFYFTNAVGNIPSASWLGIWFGLLAGVVPNAPIAGRFNSAVQNDCIGVTDSANFPPFGVAFVMYFTCDMTGGNPAKTFQWLSVILPDNQGFTGTFQFGAGDYDGNAVDSIAIRRGNFIAFTNTNPTVSTAAFPFAQYFAPPIAGNNQFIVGDFDNNGLDSFGLFFPAAGLAYFKNDLDWNSGATPGTVASYFPLGTATTAATWTGY